MATHTLDERLTAVEEELARVKRQLANNSPEPARPWWETQVGIFADDPLYDEAMRLGREWRKSQFDELD
jgi:hypothetical protein